MTLSSRWRVRAWLGLAACCLSVTPSQAETPTVMVGPAASGWVVSYHPKTKALLLHAFAVQPIGDRSLRVVRETCDETCTYDDLIVDGSMQSRSDDVTIRMTHPSLGAVVLIGQLGPTRPGTWSECSMGWAGSLSSMEANAADFHDVSWTGRMGPLRVRPFADDTCSYHHLAGTLVVS